MITIAVLSQKGGAGKTTLALNLATASEISGQPAAVIDLDPQASAKNWHDIRVSESPAVVSIHASRLAEALHTAETHGSKLSIIDTAPHSESAALTAARAAHLAIIPCRPGVLDLRAIAASVDICLLAATSAVGVINAVPPRGPLGEEAAEVLFGYGLKVAPVQLGQRMAFMHSLTAGLGVVEYEPKGRAAEEVQSLYEWTRAYTSAKTMKIKGSRCEQKTQSF